jgi:Xaa-Pro aminopeptidase
MTPEQIENLKKAIIATSDACAEAEQLISDYMKCESDISKKYLAAAIKKHASTITSHMTPDLLG